MISVSAFLPRVLPHVGGCPDPLAIQAVLDSCISFCERSLIVNIELEAIPTVLGRSAYELDLPAQTRLAQVKRVSFDGTDLRAVAFEHTDLRYGSAGSPTHFHVETQDETPVVVLSATPNIVRNLTMRVAIKPTRSATRVHEVLFEDYADAIADGALGILMAVPDQLWTNATRSVMLEQRARLAANAARVTELHGRAQSSMTVNMRAF